MLAEDVPQLHAWYLREPAMLYRPRLLPESWLRAVQANADGAQYAAYAVESGGALAGLATLWWNRTVTADLELRVLSPTVLVAPGLRGRGLGRAAVAGLLRVASVSDANIVVADVYADNAPSLRLFGSTFGAPACEYRDGVGTLTVRFVLARAGGFC